MKYLLQLKLDCTFYKVKGQGIYAFVTLAEGVPYSEELRKSLILAVRKQVCKYVKCFSYLFSIPDIL